MARDRQLDDRGQSVDEPTRDAWGRTPNDPWYGIAPGQPTGPIPLAPGVTQEDNQRMIDAGRTSAPAPSGGGSSGGSNWFTQNAPSASGFGQLPAPFGEQYTAGVYSPRTFAEQYRPPTIEDMLADPGYDARFRTGLQARDRSAAAQGSVLSGGHLKALNRYGQEYAANEYGTLNSRKLAEYQQRYGQFNDEEMRNAQAFATNESGRLNQFTTRYKSYQDALQNRMTSERDRWQREMDLANLGRPRSGE